MKKVFSKPQTWLILLLVVAMLAAVFVSANRKPVSPSGSENLSTVQCENLYTLGKVWGVAKYYHPAFTTGAANWDEELLNLLPQVLAAKNADETNALLADWLKSLDEIPPNEPLAPYVDDTPGVRRITQEPDLAWLQDGSLSKDLSAALVPLVNTPVQTGAGGPMVFNEFGRATFDNENPYEEMNYGDDAMRFLGLFRYWNAVEFYYPHKDIIDYDWDDVLAEFIPRIIEGDDELSYKRTLCELTTRVQDAHVVNQDGGALDASWGNKRPPMSFQIVEDKVVVTKLSEKHPDANPLRPGDVVLACDGKDMEEVIQEALKYHAISREGAYARPSGYLFATSQDSMKLTVLRNGQTLELDVPCYDVDFQTKPPLPSHELLADNIGLITPGYLEGYKVPGMDEITSMMEELQDTQGLIVDLRQFAINYEPFAEFIMPHPTTAANISHVDPQVPGRFYVMEPSPYVYGKENPDYYKGKIVILIDEDSISSAEFGAMVIRQAPNATVIGNNSVGADGNVAFLTLPGNLQTSFTGLCVYTPEGGQTQRIGLQPDIICKPTIEGIAQGRDELMEKAIKYITGEAVN